jgi:hypothetical protein
MARVYSLACWCFACAGVALGIVAVLAVPADAFAGEWSACVIASDKGECCRNVCFEDPTC